jgi:hypothetical protein
VHKSGSYWESSVVGLWVTQALRIDCCGEIPRCDDPMDGAEFRFWGVALNNDDECSVGLSLMGVAECLSGT